MPELQSGPSSLLRSERKLSRRPNRTSTTSTRTTTIRRKRALPKPGRKRSSFWLPEMTLFPGGRAGTGSPSWSISAAKALMGALRALAKSGSVKC